MNNKPLIIISGSGHGSASALATHNIPEGEIWCGVPAKFFKFMSKE